MITLSEVIWRFARKSRWFMVKTFATCPRADVRDASEDFKKMVEQWKRLAKFLDISEEDSRKIAFRNRNVFTVDEFHLQKNVCFLKEIGVPLKQIYEHPAILSFTPAIIQRRYHCLKDFGICPIGVPEILRYRTLMKKCAEEIQELQLLPLDCHPLDHLLNRIGFTLDLTNVSQIPNIRRMSLLHIHRMLILEILCQKLKCTRNEGLKMMSTYPLIGGRSVSILLESLKMLIDTFGFSRNKIKVNGYLLVIQPSNINAILDVFTQYKIRHVNVLLRKYPRILSISVDRLVKVNECLKKFGITESQILLCGNIYTLKPETVEERMIELTRTPIFKVINTYPKILFFVYYFKKAKERLQLLQGAGNYYTTITLDLLTASNKSFHHTSLKELLSYLSAQFDRSELEIKRILMRHPYLRLLDLQHAKDIVPLLVNRGFTLVQIFNALHIVLYDQETIEAHINNLEHSSYIQLFEDWRHHPYILQLLLYLIEKDFTSLLDSDKTDKYRATIRRNDGNAKEKHQRFKYGMSLDVATQDLCDSYEKYMEH